MKKFLGLMAVLAVTAMVSSSVFAADLLDTFTASVSFSARPTSFNAVLVNASGQEVQGKALTWNNVTDWKMNSSDDQWKKADQIIKLSATIDTGNESVVMYQDNSNASATSDYVAVSSRIVGSGENKRYAYNGLVKGGSKGGNDVYKDGKITKANYLPMAYYASDSITLPADFDLSKAASDDGYGYRFLVDKFDQKVANGETPKGYYTIANGDGFVIDVNDAQGHVDTVKSDNFYVFVGANFYVLEYGKSYGTDKLLFEKIVE
jgi:hypothetical protein